ncbi:MAG: nucleoside hydrolase, partial [Anaerolineae bacterium]|nr:nucleoside hydrolase [Anaerolineae bacterium]
HRLWQSAAPLTLFSLDATNTVPVSLAFLHRLAQQRSHPLSDLAGQCWALTVGTIPAYEYTYFMWDTLTTGYLGAPHFMTFREVQTEAIPYGPSSGRIRPVESGGKTVRVADAVDVEGFYGYLLELFRT